MPPPRAHLEGTLQLLKRLEAVSGRHPCAPPLWSFLNRPQDLPRHVQPELATFKYDAYLACRPNHLAWGVAVSDRFEGIGMLPPLKQLITDMGGQYDLQPALSLREALGRGELVVSVGFDHPTQPPRIKLYLQETTWGAGLGCSDILHPMLTQAAPDCVLPPWCADRDVGVVTVSLHPDGHRQLKVYFGGPSPAAAAAGAPASVQPLVRQMTTTSPLRGGWYYLTVRCLPGARWRYAINKIYNPVQIGFTTEQPGPSEAWNDVASLFQQAGTHENLNALYRALRGSGLLALPTATALEGQGDQTDIYLAAWSRMQKATG